MATRKTYLNSRTTKQAAFDAVVHYARTMTERSLDPLSRACKYRTKNNRCFVGALIPDYRYKPEFDDDAGVSVYALCVQFKAKPGMSTLLDDLRKIHDNYADMAQWEAMFKFVAEKYGLTYTEPTHA